MLSDSCTQKDKIHLHLFKSRLFILGQKACLNYIIIKARWASFWSSRMKSSPITSNAKNMGSAAEKRIKSILWSNLRQYSNNKEESNGKIIVLNVFAPEHYSSGFLNGVLSCYDNSMELKVTLDWGMLSLLEYASGRGYWRVNSVPWSPLCQVW